MHAVAKFSRHMASLCRRLRHAGRHAGPSTYRTGLMVSLSRRSIEAMAAQLRVHVRVVGPCGAQRSVPEGSPCSRWSTGGAGS